MTKYNKSIMEYTSKNIIESNDLWWLRIEVIKYKGEEEVKFEVRKDVHCKHCGDQGRLIKGPIEDINYLIDMFEQAKEIGQEMGRKE